MIKRSFGRALVVVAIMMGAATGAWWLADSGNLRVADAQSATSTVTLIRKIYDRADIPHRWASQTSPFRNAEYLSGGYFVVAGTCSPIVPPTEPISPQAAADNIGLQGGLYVFKADGTFVAKRNVCYDGDIPGPSASASELACNEGQACEMSSNLIPIGPTGVIRETKRLLDGAEMGMNRPPLHYEVSASGVTLAGKPYSGRRLLAADGATAGTFMTGNVAVVGNKIVSVKLQYQGVQTVSEMCGTATGEQRERFGYKNVVQTVPGFGAVREWGVPYQCPSLRNTSGVPPTSSAEVVPLAGVGEYLIGREHRDGITPVARVYRLRSDSTLERVQDLPGSFLNYIAYSYDSANPRRIGFSKANKVEVYEAGSNGLSLVRSVDADLGVYAGEPGFAVMGDYIATGGPTVRVWKGTQQIASFQLPQAPDLVPGSTATFGDRAISIEIAPNGNMIVGSHFGQLYLYNLHGNGSAPSGGTNCATNPFDPACLSGGAGTTTLPYIPGQTFNITHSTSTPAASPSVLIRMANVLSVDAAAKRLVISIFGKTFNVNAAAAQIVNSSWLATNISDFMLTRFANVWGTLDAADNTLIHAGRVRNPIPVTAASRAAASAAASASLGTGTGSGTTATGASAASTAATQVQLNSLQDALRALQQRFAR